MKPSCLLRKKHARRRRTFASNSIAVLVGDAGVVALCMLVAYYLRYSLNIGLSGSSYRPGFSAYGLHYSAGFCLFFFIGGGLGFYGGRIEASVEKLVTASIKVSFLWSLTFLGTSLIFKAEPPISRLFVGYTFVLMCVLLPFWRLRFARLSWMLGLDQGAVKRVAVLGCDCETRRIARDLSIDRSNPCEVVGLIKSRDCDASSESDLISYIGDLETLELVCRRYSIDALVVADADLSQNDLLGIAKRCEREFVDFYMVPDQFQVFTSCLGLESIGSRAVLGIARLPHDQGVSRMLKRCVDVVGACVGLVFTAMVFPIIAWLIRRESPGPVIYRQVRLGEGGMPFIIYKFRSMRLDSESDGQAGWTTEDDPRRLSIGAFLRNWNLDELPQFFNVLRGDMSLVGPRPERPELVVDFLDCIPYYQSRHTVKPGMTGWAQVHGLRGDTSLEQRIQYDLQYIENWSLWLDFSIQWRTLFNYKNAY